MTTYRFCTLKSSLFLLTFLLWEAILDTMEQKESESSPVATRLRMFATLQFGKLTDFGNAVSLTQSQVSRYTSGTPKPGYDLLERIRHTGCSMDWLMGGDGCMLLEDLRPYYQLMTSPRLGDLRKEVLKQLDPRPREYIGEGRSQRINLEGSAFRRVRYAVDHLTLPEALTLARDLLDRINELAVDTKPSTGVPPDSQ